MYNLYEEVLISEKNHYPFEAIELVRSKLKLDTTPLSITDFGAGSKSNKSSTRTVSNIARRSLKRKKYGELLFKLVNKMEPNTIIELGTSLGITTAYLAKARKKATVYTLEGCPAISKVAQTNFDLLNLTNVHLLTGNFDNTLQEVLDKVATVDLVFIDGNHKKEPTLRYFKQLLPYVNENSIIIFDDIHWSEEMEAAWNEIITHEALTVTIDLFEMGIVFFRKNEQKQHLVLKA